MAVELHNRGPLPVYRRHHREDDQRHWKYLQAATLPFVLLFWCRVARRMPNCRPHQWLLVVRLVGGLKIAFLPRSVVARVPIVRVEILFGWRILRRLRLIWLGCL